MTFGHFTSWRADDRGYYTGVERARERERQRERERERKRERERGVGHIFGANSWADVGIHKYICYI